jgi:hypothetical protein
MRIRIAMLVVIPVLLLAAVNGRSQSKVAGGFDRLKTLVGEWQATGEDGKPVTSSFRLVSNDTALEETFQSDKDHEMVTLCTADEGRVAMTHYCSMGNQPRLETPVVSATSDEFVFAFTGVTNLASPDEQHMHRMVVQIDDADHFTETWTLRAKGHDTKKVFNFVRKK